MTGSTIIIVQAAIQREKREREAREAREQEEAKLPCTEKVFGGEAMIPTDEELAFVGWLQVEVYKLIGESSIESVLAILSKRARVDYERVCEMDRNREIGYAGPSQGELSSHKQLYDRLKEWEKPCRTQLATQATLIAKLECENDILKLRLKGY